MLSGDLEIRAAMLSSDAAAAKALESKLSETEKAANDTREKNVALLSENARLTAENADLRARLSSTTSKTTTRRTTILTTAPPPSITVPTTIVTPPPANPSASYLFKDSFKTMPSPAVYAFPGNVQSPASDYMRLVPGGIVIAVKRKQPAVNGRRRTELRRAKTPNTGLHLIDPEGSTRWHAVTIGLGIPDVTKAWRRLVGKIVLKQEHQAGSTDAIDKLGPPFTLHVWDDEVQAIHCCSTPVAQNFKRTTLARWPLSEWLGKKHRVVYRAVWDNRTLAAGGKGRFDLWLDGKLVETAEANAVRKGPQGHGVGCYTTIAGLYAVAFADSADPDEPLDAVEEALYERALVGDASNGLGDFL